MSEESIQWFERKIEIFKKIGAYPSIIKIYEDELKRLKDKKDLIIYEGVP